jgi:hypothetical protein
MGWLLKQSRDGLSMYRHFLTHILKVVGSDLPAGRRGPLRDSEGHYVNNKVSLARSRSNSSTGWNC